MEVYIVEAGSELLDHRCYDIVERQFLNLIVFLDGGQHASGVYNIQLMRVHTFSPCDD